MSPSSAKDVERDGDGADVITNNRRAKSAFCGTKVKKHVAQIIKMEKVTPRSIAYIACQVSHLQCLFSFSVKNDYIDRYDSPCLLLHRGDPLMVISTMYNSGGPLWTSLNDHLVETPSAGSTSS